MTVKRSALVVGCGSIGQRHARLLGERGDIDVWACDSLEKNLVETRQKAPVTREFTDYKAGLTQHPDFVWVCTPNRLHAPVAVDALRAGAHVLCEKPLADTVEAGQAIVDAVVATGKTFLLGHTLRWFPGMKFIKQAIQEGKLGVVVAARASVQGYHSLEVARTDYRRYEKAALLLDYAHEVDYLRWFLGEVVDVKAVATTMGHLDHMMTPNVIDAVLRFAGGPTAAVHYDYVVMPGLREIEIFGDNGKLYYDTSQPTLDFTRGRQGPPEKVRVMAADYDDPYRAEIQAFLDAVDGKCAPVVSAQDGLETLKVIYRIVDSYEAA